MRIIIATERRLGSSVRCFGPSRPLPITKAGPTQLELVAEGCGYAIGALSGGMSGAIGTGAAAFRNRGGVYLASNFRIKEGLG
jgi:hypothetical protein